MAITVSPIARCLSSAASPPLRPLTSSPASAGADCGAGADPGVRAVLARRHRHGVPAAELYPYGGVAMIYGAGNGIVTIVRGAAVPEMLSM